MSPLVLLSVSNRFRALIRVALVLPGVLLLGTPALSTAGPVVPPIVSHPIVKPHFYTKHIRCLNCGMKLNMWARTRYFFALNDDEYQVCSIHCVADLARQHQATPRNVQVAVYLEPETMIEADLATYVVGSTAAGTMSAVSKIAFAKKEAAQEFADAYGGTPMSFSEAIAIASSEL